MRFRVGKAALAAVVVAVSFVPGAAGAREGAVAPCTTVSTPGDVATHVVVGIAVAPGAVAVSLRCGVVQNGRVIRSFVTASPGSVAAGVWPAHVPFGPSTTCAEVHAYFPDGSATHENNCPA
jgi:hypothetical protein